MPELEKTIRSQAKELSKLRPESEVKIAADKSKNTPIPIRLGGSASSDNEQVIPTIGVVVVEISDDIRQAFLEDGMTPWNRKGVIVARVAAGSPAYSAGLQRLDIITASNGKRVDDLQSFQDSIKASTVGKAFSMTVYRAGQPPKAQNTVMLGQRVIRQRQKKTPWERKIIKVTPAKRSVVEKAARACPISLVSASVNFNSIGQPLAHITVKNNGTANVVAYTVEIHCYNRFDEPVMKFGRPSEGNINGGLSQNTIAPGQSDSGYWTLHGRDNTAKIKIVLTKVRMNDGTEWTPLPGQKEVAIWGKSNR